MLPFLNLGSNVAKNEMQPNKQNVSAIEQTVLSATIPTPTRSNPIQPPPIRPLQMLPVGQPMRPFSSSRFGVPIKMNRFGLEPLPYPLKQMPSRFPTPDSPHSNLDLNMNLNRRFGDLNEDTTVYSNLEITESPVFSANQEENSTEEYFPTVVSIKESKSKGNINNFMNQNVTNTHQKKYQISDQLSEETTSPMPVYTTSSTDANNISPQSTSFKPLYLHKEEFASQLNNMYYNRPEVFEPMMNQFLKNVH